MTTAVLGTDIAHRIEQRFPGAVVEAVPEFAVVAADRLVEVMTWLRDDPEMSFKFLSNLAAVDTMEWFEIVYHLESFKHNRDHGDQGAGGRPGEPGRAVGRASVGGRDAPGA